MSLCWSHIPHCLPSHVATQLCVCCINVAVCVLCFFLAVPWVGQLFASLAFSGHFACVFVPNFRFIAEVVYGQSLAKKKHTEAQNNLARWITRTLLGELLFSFPLSFLWCKIICEN